MKVKYREESLVLYHQQDVAVLGLELSPSDSLTQTFYISSAWRHTMVEGSVSIGNILEISS